MTPWGAEKFLECLTRLPGWWHDPGMRRALSFLPPLVLLAAAATLLLGWSELPPQWPVHWDAEGRVNGWMPKSMPTALMPLLFGAVLWVFLEGMAWFMEGVVGRRPIPNMDAADATELARATADLLRFMAFGVSVLFAFVGAGLPFHPEWAGNRLAAPILFGFLLAVLALGFVWFYVRAKRLRLPAGYSGLAYSNPDDKRLWVPKLLGPGWTINFAHPMAWPALVAVLAIPVGLAVLIIYLRR